MCSVLLSKIFRNLSQFYQIQTGVGPREVLHTTKTKTIKWALNTHDDFINLKTEDLFWAHVIVSYIYCEQNTIKIYTKGYVQCIITCVIRRVFKKVMRIVISLGLCGMNKWFTNQNLKANVYSALPENKLESPRLNSTVLTIKPRTRGKCNSPTNIYT